MLVVYYLNATRGIFIIHVMLHAMYYIQECIVSHAVYTYDFVHIVIILCC